MLRCWIAVALVLALSCAAEARAARKCEVPRSERIVAQSVQVVVTRTRGGRGHHSCWKPSGRRSRMLVGDAYAATRLQITKRYVGYVRTSLASSEGLRLIVQAHDARSGRPVLAADAYANQPGSRGYGNGRVTRLEVTASGDLVWIALDPTTEDQPQVYIKRRTTRAAPPPQPIDAGHEIDPLSLAVSGDLVYWLKHGTPQMRRISSIEPA